MANFGKRHEDEAQAQADAQGGDGVSGEPLGRFQAREEQSVHRDRPTPHQKKEGGEPEEEHVVQHRLQAEQEYPGEPQGGQPDRGYPGEAAVEEREGDARLREAEEVRPGARHGVVRREKVALHPVEEERTATWTPKIAGNNP